MKTAKKWKNRAADQNVMEMRHDEERVVDLQVDGNGSEHDPGETAQHKKEHESHHEQQRCSKANSPAPERHEPAEDLDAAGNCDHHAGGGKKAFAELR